MRRAFTLIEILVVIAIIAILAAIAVPVLVRSKEAAKSTDSLTRLRQIGHAIHLYSADHQDTLPHAVGSNCFQLALRRNRDCVEPHPASLAIAIGPLNAALLPYGIPFELHRSPVDRMYSLLLTQPGTHPTWYEETTTARFPGSSYEYNSRLGLSATAMSSLSGPAETLLVQSLFILEPVRVQVAFADGHLKTVPTRTLDSYAVN